MGKRLNINEITEQLAIDGFNPFAYTKKGNGLLGKKAIESYVFYYDILALLGQIAYRWKNIPLEIPYYQMEKCLFHYGIAGITKDEEVDKYIILPAIISGSSGLNIYGEGKKYTLFSKNATYNIEIENGVNGFVCFNNARKKGNSYLAYRYAKRLQMIDEIIDMNIDQQKEPYIIAVNEKDKTTLENIFTKLELGDRAIYTTKDLDIENALKVLELNVDLKALDLQQAKREIFNEACMYMGITANLPDKKERLITSEVQTEERRYDIFREVGLAPRKYFCDIVNKALNLELDVEYVLEEKELKDMENKIATTTKKNRQIKDN